MAAPSTEVELLIQEVRDLHPAFDRYRADPSVALRAMRRVLLSLCQAVQEARPEALEWVQTVAPFNAAHFIGAGLDLGVPIMAMLEVEIRQLGTSLATQEVWVPVERLGWDGKLTTAGRLAVQIRRSTIYPVQVAQEWVGYDQWRVSYVQHPSALTLRGSTATVTQLPLGTFRNALVLGTGLELAFGLSGQPDAPNPAMFQSRAETAREEALISVTSDQRQEVFRKRDVMGWME